MQQLVLRLSFHLFFSKITDLSTFVIMFEMSSMCTRSTCLDIQFDQGRNRGEKEKRERERETHTHTHTQRKRKRKRENDLAKA